MSFQPDTEPPEHRPPALSDSGVPGPVGVGTPAAAAAALAAGEVKSLQPRAHLHATAAAGDLTRVRNPEVLRTTALPSAPITRITLQITLRQIRVKAKSFLNTISSSSSTCTYIW